MSPSILGAAAAARTRRLGIGFAVHVTPLHHPLRLAEQIALIDQLSEGRVIAGFGPGYAPGEFALYGVDFEERHARHREILEIVLQAWTRDEFDYSGEFYRFERARLALRPFQRPHPPVAIAAGRAESIRETARRGAQLMVLGGLESIRDKVAVYSRAIREAELPAAQAGRCLRHVGALRQIWVTKEPVSGAEGVAQTMAYPSVPRCGLSGRREGRKGNSP